MASLVSQAEAVRQLRLNEAAMTTDQLDDVNFKAEQASAIIVDYLKRPFIEGPLTAQPTKARAAKAAPPPAATQEDWTDAVPPAFFPPGAGWDQPPAPSVPPVPPDPWTPANVPVLVKAAILIVLTSLYDGRTPEDALLSPQITGILERLRDPALA
jgi:hypothetical protein